MSNFNFIGTKIDGVFIVEPKVFGDSRGYFMETYHEQKFFEGGITAKFVQDNQSKSTKGVLRGLHFQKNHPQAKLVRVIKGEVYDVAVDIRKGSPTYGQYVGIVLSEENKKQFFIPRGFAHGFLVLSDEAEFVYKCDDLPPYFHNPVHVTTRFLFSKSAILSIALFGTVFHIYYLMNFSVLIEG